MVGGRLGNGRWQSLATGEGLVQVKTGVVPIAFFVLTQAEQREPQRIIRREPGQAPESLGCVRAAARIVKQLTILPQAFRPLWRLAENLGVKTDGPLRIPVGLGLCRFLLDRKSTRLNS